MRRGSGITAQRQFGHFFQVINLYQGAHKFPALKFCKLFNRFAKRLSFPEEVAQKNTRDLDGLDFQAHILAVGVFEHQGCL